MYGYVVDRREWGGGGFTIESPAGTTRVRASSPMAAVEAAGIPADEAEVIEVRGEDLVLLYRRRAVQVTVRRE